MTPRELLDNAQALFLDFDGPIAALMPPPRNAQAASSARRPLAGIDLPIAIEETTDHLAVLHWARANTPDELLLRVEAACTEAEIEAAATCAESQDAAALFEFAEQRRLPVAIVSNNSESAVRQFFERRGWLDRVQAFCCRTPGTVAQMKPKPAYLQRAASDVGIEPANALFVGDSCSDVHSGRALGIPVLGVAKNESRADELREAGAVAVVLRGQFSSH